jgi:histidine ammonia-lyase
MGEQFMTIMLNGSDLTVTEVVAAARHGEPVALAPEAIAAMRQARAPGQLGLGTGRAYRMIRELVPFTQADGTLPADLEPLVDLVTRGDLAPAA